MKQKLIARKLLPKDIFSLFALFKGINNSEDLKLFNPHPMDHETAVKICTNPGKDLFIGAFENNQLVAYGMLRGWEQGYETPSLGIYIHPDYRGKSIGRWFMKELHDIARQSGSIKIRLSVEVQNHKALKLYESLGYNFQTENKKLVGYLNL